MYKGAYLNTEEKHRWSTDTSKWNTAPAALFASGERGS